MLALCSGRYALTPLEVCQTIGTVLGSGDDAPTSAVDVVFRLRIPRIIAAILVGFALATAGATYQGIFRNPLVSPDLLGVSSGACVGAAASILLGLGVVYQQIFAFIGGVVTVCLAVSIPHLMKRQSSLMLVLSGVIVGGFMSSIIGLFKYIADSETQLPDIVYWQLGSLAKTNWDVLGPVIPVIVVSSALVLAMRWRLNVLALDERDVQTLGVNLKLERGVAIILSTLLTACAVCISGTIGWIGLVMPHIARSLVGANNVRLIPVAGLTSSIFLLLIDTAARTLSGAELPLGVLTGFIGAPVFAYILVKTRGDRP